MADYESTADVQASPRAVFAYLSDVDNLPEYFARMRTARRVPGRDAVQTSAELPDGQLVNGEAWFEVDETAMTMRWGSEGPRDYHGELSVTGSERGARVWVLISTDRVESDQVQDGVDATVAAVREKVETAAGAPT